ncbi:GTP cyclohydrolase I [Nocardiopsis sp. NPDC049922]|uniref:GTP cyclohydrolase I n=1 Tax=Nocardiopsis sp. NPDC049922 TaxID=3155157 RepID=UPI0033D0CFE6
MPTSTMTMPPSPAVHVPDRTADLTAATRAATELLAALGVPATTEGTRRTPERMAQALLELLTPQPFDMTTFPAEGYRQMVLVRSIPFTSVCEHHMLAFHGTACLAYIPGERMLGLSKLARVVELFARRPQVQERMTQQIADFLQDHLAPEGVGAIVRAEHTCMTLRGAQAVGSATVTSALHGRLLNDARARDEFIALTGVRA